MPQDEGEKKYTEAELRLKVAEAFRESAKIVYGAFSFPAAHQRMLKRAEEIEKGGPFAAPPNHWSKA